MAQQELTHVFPDLTTLSVALNRALEVGDVPAALDALSAASPEIPLEHGAEYRELVALLPEDAWSNRPEIVAALGTSHRSAGSPRGAAALGYVTAAEAAISAGAIPAHTTAAVLLVQVAALRALGRLDAAQAKFDEASELSRTDPAGLAPTRVSLGARGSLEVGILKLHIGHLASAADYLTFAAGLAADHLPLAQQVECFGTLAMVDFANGHLDGALTNAARAHQLGDGTTLFESGFGAPALTAEVLVAAERYELDAAERLLPDLMEAAGRTEWEPFAFVVSAQLKALRHSPIAALDELQLSRQAYTTWQPVAFGHDLGEVVRAGILIAVDHGDEAWTVLAALDPYRDHALCPARFRAQLRLTHGDVMGADAALRECEELGDAHSPRTLIDVQLLRGAIEFERGNFTVSDVNTDRALLRMARTGTHAPLGRIPSDMLRRMMARALNRPQDAQVARILQGVSASTHGATPSSEPLSERERAVLEQVERGRTVAAIAAQLFISPNTVKTHLRRLYRKLGVSTRDDAIRKARALGLHLDVTRDSPGGDAHSRERAVI